MKHTLANVRNPIAVGIFQEHQIGLLGNIRAAIAQRYPDRQMQLVGKHRLFVGFAVARRILIDQNLIIDRGTRQVLWIAGVCRHPQSASCIDVECDRVNHFGEVDFGNDQVDLETIGQHEHRLAFFGRQILDIR